MSAAIAQPIALPSGAISARISVGKTVQPEFALGTICMASATIAQMTEKFHIWLVEDSEADELLMRQALKLDGMDCDFQVSEDGEKSDCLY